MRQFLYLVLREKTPKQVYLYLYNCLDNFPHTFYSQLFPVQLDTVAKQQKHGWTYRKKSSLITCFQFTKFNPFTCLHLSSAPFLSISDCSARSMAFSLSSFSICIFFLMASIVDFLGFLLAAEEKEENLFREWRQRRTKLSAQQRGWNPLQRNAGLFWKLL